MAQTKSRTPEEVAREGAESFSGSPAGGTHHFEEAVARRPMTPTPAPAPVALPDNASMADIVRALVGALQSIASGQQDARSAAQQALDMSAKMQQPDNRNAPRISVFNPQGDLYFPRPALKCKMFIPWQAEAESLTFEEIELLNLLEPGEFSIARNDGKKVNVIIRAAMNDNGRMDRLLLNSETAFNNDNHWMMPPLTVLLRQILESRPFTREASRQVLTMDERFEKVASGEFAVSVGTR